MTVEISGTCACEAVKFRVTDNFNYSANCHCSLCRRATGSAFKPFGGIARQELKVVRGEDNLKKVGNDIDHDVRCVTCGSYLFSVVREGLFVHVCYGSLTDSPSLQPTEHIFVGSKATWYEILDDLPQHDEFAEKP